MDNRYGGVIWTNHALERLRERGVSQSDAFVTFNNPSQTRHASTKNAWVYYRDFKNYRLEVVAAQNERKQWVIMSVWSKPLWSVHLQENPLSAWLSKIVQKLMQKLFGGLQKKFSSK